MSSTPPDPGEREGGPPAGPPPWEDRTAPPPVLSPWQQQPDGPRQGLGGLPGSGGGSPPDGPAYGAPGPDPHGDAGYGGAQHAQPGPYPPPGQGGAQYAQPGPYPPPGQGGPPHPQPGPARRRTGARRLLPLLAGLAVAVVALVVVAVLVLPGSPRDTADGFMAALQANDVDKAHSLLCKDGQQKESKEELRRSFGLDERSISGYRLGTERRREREGKDETLIPVTISYDRGPEVNLDLGIWNEGGQKICSLNPPGSG